MKDPLVVDIRSTVHNNVLIYIVQITHQKYIGSYFTDTGHNFIASNGFRLSSQACPALNRKNSATAPIQINGKRINGTWNYDKDMVCVRGSSTSRNNTRMYTDSTAYIEKLKSAVVEYNKYMQGA